MNIVRNLTEAMKRVDDATKIDKAKCVYLWGCWYEVPSTGEAKVDTGSGCYKYNFGTSEVTLLGVNDEEVFTKKVNLQSFLKKEWKWLSLMKREASLQLNLDEEVADEPCEKCCEEGDYFGYIDEEGDVIREVEGLPVDVMSVDEMCEEFGTNYTVNEEGEIYMVNEKLAKDSYPREGFVYWNKKHDKAYSVVAVYPKAKDEKKQVSYWDDEGKRYTSSIQDFQNKMVPSTDEEDYEIFEDCDDKVDEALVATPTAVNGKSLTIHINGKKYSYFPTEESGLTAKELKAKFDALAKHNIGRALAWVKKNATTKDSYKK